MGRPPGPLASTGFGPTGGCLASPLGHREASRLTRPPRQLPCGRLGSACREQATASRLAVCRPAPARVQTPWAVEVLVLPAAAAAPRANAPHRRGKTPEVASNKRRLHQSPTEAGWIIFISSFPPCWESPTVMGFRGCELANDQTAAASRPDQPPGCRPDTVRRRWDLAAGGGRAGESPA